MTTSREQLERRSSLLRSNLVFIGLPLLAAIVFIDSYALRARRGDATDWQVLGSYAIFVGQTALLSTVVGWQARREVLWWGILGWGVLLVDLQLFAIAAPDNWSTANTVGFAFASAQVAALVCFALLSGMRWPIRLSVSLVGTALAIFFAFAMNARQAWYLVLAVQCFGAATVCLVFRQFRFRIERCDSVAVRGEVGSYAQFSIRHLFYWTTGVAILVAFGRLVSWQGLLSAGMRYTTLSDLFVFGPILSFVSILAMWAALGGEAWFVRLGVAVIALPGAGAILGAYVRWGSGRGRFNELFPDFRGSPQPLETGIAWTVLAGGMLAGLLLSIRATGNQLRQRTDLRLR
ncbi:MAG: hypothetical protein H8E66_02690 [Planctomycetes bacterium]|nr:hypothetical protein [Planctomycetota bacterium]